MRLRKAYPENPRSLEQGSANKTPRMVHLDLGVYYWIWGWADNRRILWGPYMSEKEAYTAGYERLQTDFEVIPLRTRDETSASRQMRARLLEEQASVSDTFRPFGHKVEKKQKEDE